MEWEQDALDAVAKAPSLLRSMIKRKVENRVASGGRTVVTLTDVREARSAEGPKAEPRSKSATDTEEIGISADQIEKVVSSTPQSSVVSQSRFYEVKVCGGAFGCPRTLFDVQRLADKFIARIDASGVADAVAARVSGPVLRHHKFSVAISGCPNSCSQPQINDFGVQGRARVSMGPGPCIECMECVRVCNEGSVTVAAAVPDIDRSKCINCGDCAVVCPTEALVAEERGFTSLIGGKLGRHPQLAREILEFTDEEGLMASLEVAIEMFECEMLPRERLADTVTRIGVETIRQRVIEKNRRIPK